MFWIVLIIYITVSTILTTIDVQYVKDIERGLGIRERGNLAILNFIRVSIADASRRVPFSRLSVNTKAIESTWISRGCHSSGVTCYRVQRSLFAIQVRTKVIPFGNFSASWSTEKEKLLPIKSCRSRSLEGGGRGRRGEGSKSLHRKFQTHPDYGKLSLARESSSITSPSLCYELLLVSSSSEFALTRIYRSRIL